MQTRFALTVSDYVRIAQVTAHKAATSGKFQPLALNLRRFRNAGGKEPGGFLCLGIARRVEHEQPWIDISIVPEPMFIPAEFTRIYTLASGSARSAPLARKYPHLG
jgi:hypothetical protein